MVQAARIPVLTKKGRFNSAGGCGKKAGEDLSEKISGLGLPPGVHSADRGEAYSRQRQRQGG